MSSNRAELLKKPLLKFYKNKENMDKFVNVLERKTDYSLRVIEWFCNNYSKKYDIIYKTSNNKEINVYLSYKSQLNSYQKKQFDPFKRKHEGFETFELKHGKDKKITTTVGQLNFFRWCIMNDVLEYIEKHIKHIKEDMDKTVKYYNPSQQKKKQTIESKPVSRKKRQPLSVSATKNFIKKCKTIILEFD